MNVSAWVTGLLLGSLIAPLAAAGEPDGVRRLPVSVYREKLEAGWIGQIAGVCWGAPTEFKWQDRIIPAAEMPRWRPEMINGGFGQDDLYVEMTFLRTLEEYGIDVSIRQAGLDFANSGYPLWCANYAGRTNLRRGIAPPDSGHPQFNRCPNDIDYQIEADYSGLIAPGMPQVAVDLGEKFGRLMNYGDGRYAGQFIGALYAAAFFEEDPVRLVETALRAIPADSQYAEMVRDMVAWYRADPEHWEATWEKCQVKYRQDPVYQQASNGGIDCKINGAYVLMGLLYGNRDPEQTIVISCRCGMDSDCNPSSAGGVLFTILGIQNVPARFTSDLDPHRTFSHTAYNFPQLVAVCERLARQFLQQQGGHVERADNGAEVFVIPVREPVPSRLELSWAPQPIAGSRFTKDEMAQMTYDALPSGVKEAVDALAPGWEIKDCGPDMNPGLYEHWEGRSRVLCVHPFDVETGCVLSRTVAVPAGRQTHLRLLVAHDPRGDFDLIVRVDGEQVLHTPVSDATCQEGCWLRQEIDLTPFAGREIKLELVNQPTGWSFEAAYWGEIAIVSQ